MTPAIQGLFFLQQNNYLMADKKLFKEAIFSYFDNQNLDVKEFKINILKIGQTKDTSLARVNFSPKKNNLQTVYLKKYSSIEDAKEEFDILKKIPVFNHNSNIDTAKGKYIFEKIILFEELKGNQLITLLNKDNQKFLIDIFTNLGEWLSKFHELNLNLQKEADDMESVKNFTDDIDFEYKHYLKKFSKKFLDDSMIINSRDMFSVLLSRSDTKSSYGICHGDFCFQNLIINNQENKVNIIDFEECSSDYQYKDLAFFCAKLKLLQLFIPNKAVLLDKLEYNFLEGYQKQLDINQNQFELIKFMYLHRINSPLSFKFFLNPSNLRVLILRKRYSDLISKEINRLKKINI